MESGFTPSGLELTIITLQYRIVVFRAVINLVVSLGGGGGGSGFRREIDEETLKQVADMTGGSYHLAASANELQDVFQNLPTQLMTVTETTEVSVIFVVAGALLVALAIALSIIWHPIS